MVLGSHESQFIICLPQVPSTTSIIIEECRMGQARVNAVKDDYIHGSTLVKYKYATAPQLSADCEKWVKSYQTDSKSGLSWRVRVSERCGALRDASSNRAEVRSSAQIMSESRRSKKGNSVSPWGDTKREVAAADPVVWQDMRRPNLDDRRVDTCLLNFWRHNECRTKSQALIK